MDANIGRLSAIQDLSSGTAATVVTYSYQGLNTVVGETLPQPASANLVMSETLDSFGRVSEWQWNLAGHAGAMQATEYSYNNFGEVTVQNDLTLGQLSTVTTYDPLGRAVTFNRGQLNPLGTALADPTTGADLISYTYDGTNDLVGIVAASKVDPELASLSVDQTGDLSAIGFSSNQSGDLTTMGQNNWTEGMSGVYDAWGRLVQVSGSNPGTPTETFGYDALGRQITLSVAIDLGSFPIGFVPNTTPVSEQRAYYYDQSGDIIQETDTANGQIETQYVWSPVTGQIVLRDYSTADNGTLNQRLFPLYDPQGNVVALVDGASNVIERYVYDATGNMQALTGAGNAELTADNPSNPSDQRIDVAYGTPENAYAEYQGGSDQGWEYFYQGMRRDAFSDLYLDGSTDYSPRIGRWVQQQSPQQRAMTTGYTYSMDQLDGGDSMWDELPGAIASTIDRRVDQFGQLGQQFAYTVADLANDAVYDYTFWSNYIDSGGTDTDGGASFYNGHLSSTEQAIDSGTVDPLSWSYVGQSAESVINGVTFGTYGEVKATGQYALGDIGAAIRRRHGRGRVWPVRGRRHHARRRNINLSADLDCMIEQAFTEPGNACFVAGTQVIGEMNSDAEGDGGWIAPAQWRYAGCQRCVGSIRIPIRREAETRRHGSGAGPAESGRFRAVVPCRGGVRACRLSADDRYFALVQRAYTDAADDQRASDVRARPRLGTLPGVGRGRRVNGADGRRIGRRRHNVRAPSAWDRGVQPARGREPHILCPRGRIDGGAGLGA